MTEWRRTGAQSAVGALELIARGIVVTLGGDAFEVVDVALEAVRI